MQFSRQIVAWCIIYAPLFFGLFSCEKFSKVVVERIGETRRLNQLKSMKRDTVDGRFAISYPTGMTACNELNSMATFQRQNQQNDTYLMIFDESKADFIQAYVDASGYDSSRTVIRNYNDAVIQNMRARLDSFKLLTTRWWKINRSAAITTEFKGSIRKDSLRAITIHYSITFVEGRNRLYQLVSWTAEEAFATYAPEFDLIASSFQEFQ
jgi:hypothetical protein